MIYTLVQQQTLAVLVSGYSLGYIDMKFCLVSAKVAVKFVEGRASRGREFSSPPHYVAPLGLGRRLFKYLH